MLVNPTVECRADGHRHAGAYGIRTVEARSSPIFLRSSRATGYRARRHEFRKRSWMPLRAPCSLLPRRGAPDQCRSGLGNGGASSTGRRRRPTQRPRCRKARRERGHDKGGAGPRACLLRRTGGEGAKARLQARLAKEELTRLMGSGFGRQVPGAEPAGFPAEGSDETRPDRGGSSAAAGRSPDCEARAGGDGQILQADRGHPLRHRPQPPCWLRDRAGKGGRRHLVGDDGPGRSRIRHSHLRTAANAACARPSSPICGRRTFSPRRPSMSARKHARPIRPTAQLRHRPALPQQRRAAAHRNRGTVTPHLQRDDHQPFELLADSREKVDAILLAIDAKRDFWLAERIWLPAIYGGARLPAKPRSRRPPKTANEKGNAKCSTDDSYSGASAATGIHRRLGENVEYGPCRRRHSWRRRIRKAPSGLPPGPTTTRGDHQRLDRTPPDEQRRQGVPSRREPVEREMAEGMTAISGAITASRRVRRSRRRRRSGPHFRHQQAAGADDDPLARMILPSAWTASAGCRSRTSRPARLSSTSSIS